MGPGYEGRSSGSSIDDEVIGDEGTNVSKPIFKNTKTPGMLMNSTSTSRGTRARLSEQMEDNTDEFIPNHELDISSKIKAMEFKVNKGLSGN